MIDFYYWPTPNGWKVSIMLEECGLPYRMVPVNIGKGDQFKPEFLAISPNNKMPAIVDHEPDGETVSVFESGAILLHLAEKCGRSMPTDRARPQGDARVVVLAGRQPSARWQDSSVTSSITPRANMHIPSALCERIQSLPRVLERRLEGRKYILGDYSIADMASFPWVLISKPLVRRSTSSPTSPAGVKPSSSDRRCSAASISARSCAAARHPLTRSAASCSIRQRGTCPRRSQAIAPM